MATVYLAEDLKHQRKVAVKVLRADLAASLGPERFLREVTIAANLQHPHILPLHDSGEADGFLYYVMPYVEGTSLRQKLIREGELPIPDAVRILRDIADAMAYAHQHGVVHRDIKPENVMLSGRHALVTDFGVAKAVSEATGRQTLTTAGVALGTPAYMAPEQAAADPHTDHRADIYAFGVVAYELLTGRPPFTGASPQAILAAHVTTAADPVTKFRASIPPALAALVMRCLEKKPADRWQSADELMPALEQVLTPSGGMTPTFTQPFPGVSRRRRAAWLLAGAAVVTGAVGIGFYLRARSKPAAFNRVVVLPFENRTGAASWDHLSLLAADYITRSLLETGLLQVVPMTASAAVASALAKSAGGALPQRVAKETGAGLAVSGAYYLAGDSLRFVVELTDAVGEKLLTALDPVLAGAKDPMPGLERLRRAIAGALAARVDPTWATWASVSKPPPSYEALKLFQEGQAAFWRDYREGQRLWHQAFTLDTTYEVARMFEAIAYSNLGEYDQADSLARLSEQHPAQLGPFDKAMLALLRAWLDGDNQAAYRVTKAGNELAPSAVSLMQQGFEAIKLNRPREGLESLGRLTPTSPELKGVWQYWDLVAGAHHMLEQHDQELTAAGKGRKQYLDLLSTLYVEARALAAAGKAEDASRLLDQSVNIPLQAGWTPGLVAYWTGLEFLAHGDSVAAEGAFSRAVAWYQKLPEQQRSGELMGYGEALYYTRRYAEAGEVFGRACTTTPNTPACLGWAGLVKARSGQRQEALALKEAIGKTDSTPRYRISQQAYWQARIAAVLGDRDGAVELFRRAFTYGWTHSADDHREYDFRALLDYPQFKELVKPTG